MWKWFCAIAAAVAIVAVGLVVAGLAPFTAGTSVAVGAGVVSLITGVVHLQIGNAPAQPTTTPVPTQPNNLASLSSQKTAAAKASISVTTEAMFALAQSHLLQRNGKKKDIKKAFHCYLEAAKGGHEDALTPLERLGNEMPAAKQMELSQMYGTLFNNQEKAAYWRDKAKEVEQFTFNM